MNQRAFVITLSDKWLGDALTAEDVRFAIVTAYSRLCSGGQAVSVTEWIAPHDIGVARDETCLRLMHLSGNNAWAFIYGASIIGIGQSNQHLYPTRESACAAVNVQGLIVADDGRVLSE